PVEQAAKTLPAGGAESLSAGQNALASGLSTAKPTIDQTAPAVLPADSNPLEGLLGGLPVKELPVSQDLGGLPVGGAGGGLPVGLS
ncbi:hypothetical protein P8605_20250, partial [Streptomyces sp. T-3]|nr:hypothetical protein [Streptomyces sp. T-3]